MHLRDFLDLEVQICFRNEKEYLALNWFSLQQLQISFNCPRRDEARMDSKGVMYVFMDCDTCSYKPREGYKTVEADTIMRALAGKDPAPAELINSYSIY